MTYQIESYPTERAAIEAARNAAADFAMSHDYECEEKVLLANGNTLLIKSDSKGELSERTESGHIMSGNLFCSKKIAELF